MPTASQCHYCHKLVCMCISYFCFATHHSFTCYLITFYFFITNLELVVLTVGSSITMFMELEISWITYFQPTQRCLLVMVRWVWICDIQISLVIGSVNRSFQLSSPSKIASTSENCLTKSYVFQAAHIQWPIEAEN